MVFDLIRTFLDILPVIKFRFAAALLVLVPVNAILRAAPTTAPAPQTPEQIRAIVQPYIDDGYVPAMVVGVVDATGVRVQAFGVDDRDGGSKPITSQSVFEIGSVTKVFTGLLLADAVQRGEVTLDEPVQQLLPPDVKLAESKPRPIELIDLATHRSGLPRMPSNVKPADPTKPYDDYTVDRVNDFLRGWKPSYAPGEHVEYSNLAVGLLGHLLAAKAGTTYAGLVQERIFKPLAIECDPLSGEVVAGHDEDGNRVPNWLLPEPVAGAGCLRTSGESLMKFIEAQVRPPKGELGAAIESSHTARARYENGASIGLNWLIRPDGVRWHNGETGGFTSYVGFDPRTRVGVAVLENCRGNWAVHVGVTVLHRELGLPDPKLPRPRKAVQLSEAELDRFVGDYRVGILSILSVRRSGEKLTAQMTGQPPMRIYPESPTRCFWKAVDAQADFAFDGEKSITMHQNGRDTHGKATTMPTTGPA